MDLKIGLQLWVYSNCGFTQIVELPTPGSNLLDLRTTYNRPTLIHQSVPGISDHIHDMILTQHFK